MEQHPVPQNITTFQFRLIGDMTIKQFGYLASGVILAYISFKLPLPFFFTWPLTILSALAGFGLAFVPIEERPMDIWITAFIKNVYSPTQYVWQKTKQLAQTPTRPEEAKSVPGLMTQVSSRLAGLVGTPKTRTPLPLAAAVPALPETPTATPAVAPASPSRTAPVSTGELVDRLFSPREPTATPKPATQVTPGPAVILSTKPGGSFFEWIKNLLTSKPLAPAPATHQFVDMFANVPLVPATTQGQAATIRPQPGASATSPVSAPEATGDTRVAELETNLQKLKQELETTTLSEKRILELQKQLNEVLAAKDRLEKEVVRLRQTSQHQPAAAWQPARTTPPSSETAGPTVRVITPETAVKVGLPRLTTFPNIVTGIVKDEKGNLLSGVLVTVRDKTGLPLRALKTNKLGQFAASTPLPNGTYLVEVEDPRGNFTFDRVQISVTGIAMPAIEIFAKSQKQLERDKLAAELFGNQKPV